MIDRLKAVEAKVAAMDWSPVLSELHDRGFVTVRNILDAADCDALIAAYPEVSHYRKTIDMARYRFGLGEYKYFRYPLPPLVAALRAAIYPRIVPVANAWMRELELGVSFPATNEEMISRCHANGQIHPTPLILKYDKGGFNTLHQDLYGPVYFPMQLVIMLNEPGVDYSGGELVITEQIPRAQSKANVLRAGRGDMVIFTTNFRPAKGSRGYYRVTMKHGVSPLIEGRRYSMGVIFHDALS